MAVSTLTVSGTVTDPELPLGLRRPETAEEARPDIMGEEEGPLAFVGRPKGSFR